MPVCPPPFRGPLTRPAHRRSSSEGRTSMNTSTAFWFLVVIAPGHMQHTRLQAAGVVQHLPGKRPKRLALTTKSGSPAAADSAEWVRRSAEPAGHQGEADMAAWATRLSGLLQTTGQPLPMLQQLSLVAPRAHTCGCGLLLFGVGGHGSTRWAQASWAQLAAGQAGGHASSPVSLRDLAPLQPCTKQLPASDVHIQVS